MAEEIKAQDQASKQGPNPASEPVSQQTSQPVSQQVPEQQPGAPDGDVHRGFVREMNKRFASVYGYGGAGVIAVVGAVVGLAYTFGQLGSPLVWIGAVIAFLVALFVLRIVVRRRARRMHERIRQYCAVNDLEVDTFKDRYTGEGLYPYFESIFEVIERRQQIANQLRDSQ